MLILSIKEFGKGLVDHKKSKFVEEFQRSNSSCADLNAERSLDSRRVVHLFSQIVSKELFFSLE